MWYPASVTTAPGVEPVSEAEAKAQVDSSAATTLIEAQITSARVFVEAYCGSRLITQTLAAKCDCFDDLARLPEAPIQSVTLITYVDTAGVTQTLSTDVYELRADGLEAGIVRKYNQVWPAIRLGSRITLTAVAGYGDVGSNVPAPIRQAIILLVRQLYSFAQRKSDLVRESIPGVGTFEYAEASGSAVPSLPIAAESLLANYRRGI